MKVGELRQLIAANRPNVIFLNETKLKACDFDKVKRRCNMTGCFVIDSNRSKGGLAVLWDDEISVDIQSYSSNHIDMLVKRKTMTNFNLRGYMAILSLGNDTPLGT